ARFAKKAGKNIRRISKKTLDLFLAYPWPGNIRELQNVVERSVIVSETENFSVDESWLSRPPRAAQPKGHLTLNRLSLREREIIEAALSESGGRGFRPSRGPRLLGISGRPPGSKITEVRILQNHLQHGPTIP